MKLNFKSERQPNQGAPPSVKNAIIICAALHDGDLIDTMSLSAQIKLAEGYVAGLARYADLAPYTTIYQRTRWWGNAATIAELRKQS